MGFRVITPPVIEPITLAEAKLHLRVDQDADDAYISSLISAAREQAEHITGRALAPQTIALSLDEFPEDGIKLPMPPVTSITSLSYVDGAGDTQTMDANDYYLDDAQEPNWIVPTYGGTWPGITAQANAVVVTYIAGYENCPEPIRSWMLLRIGDLYRSRESASDKPMIGHSFADRLLDRYRIWPL